mgnify:CR=1 FL=1
MDSITKKLAIVGLGALGSRASLLLAEIGINNFVLIDRDIVEEKNLERQKYGKEDVGKAKVNAISERLTRIRGKIKITRHFDNLDYTNAGKLLQGADLILDCTDNFETRFLINDFSVKYKVPFIYGAAIADRGFVFNVIPEGACLKCILGDARTNETCETSGILNETSDKVAELQVEVAMKILSGKDYNNELKHINISNQKFERFKVQKSPSCETCNGNFQYLEGKKASKVAVLCGNSFLIRGSFDYRKVRENLSKMNTNGNSQKDFGNAFIFDKLTVFDDGRALVRASSQQEALSLFSRYVGN